ncbi:MAG: type II toxin-antitoxin system VapC family toxin [Candidatus Dormibacteraceae bacterium]
MAVVVLDASVVIALISPEDIHHLSAVHSLKFHAGDSLYLPASAYSECLVVPNRQDQVQDAKSRIQELFLKIIPISEVIAEIAAELRSQHSWLRLPDAMILACARSIQAEVLLTGDKKWQKLDPSVRLLS